MGKLFLTGADADKYDLRLMKAAKVKALAEAWITEVCDAAVKMGRTAANFVHPPAEQIPNEVRKTLNARGIRVYVGGDNLFLVDVNGEHPRLIPRRPLAQRYAQLHDA